MHTTQRLAVVFAALVVLTLVFVGVFSTAHAAPGASFVPAVYSGHYSLGSWPVAAEGPYAGVGLSDCHRDSTGVCIEVVNGVTYNHPVFQAQDGLGALALYIHNGPSDTADLALAQKEAARLVSTHLTNSHTGASWWFPYRFSFEEYGLSSLTFHPPWYSGMAQGAELDLFARLYLTTGNKAYRTDAIAAFDSFLEPLLSGQSVTAHPWVDRVDSTGHFWVEEYPSARVDDDVINGYGFALYGLVDYYQIVKDSRALPLIQEGLLTFLYGADHARNPGGIASYSLSERSDRSAGYHVIVTAELQNFATLTGDIHYANERAEYYSDYHVAGTSNAVPEPGWPNQP